MYKYSMTQWIVGNEEMEYSFQRLKTYGYDGIELAAEPYNMDSKKLCGLLKKYELICTSLCGIFTNERDLSSDDPQIVSRSIKYLEDSVDLAVKVGAPYIIVVPSPVGRTKPLAGCTYEGAWKNAVQTIRKAANYAQKRDVFLAIEAVNRYETYLVNNLKKNLEFIKEVNHPAVKLMIDCFHMSIEENNFTDSIHMVADHLIHVHISDSTREAAGLGHTDFKEILYALKRIGYKGPLTMEFLPRMSNPYAVQDMHTHSQTIDKQAAQSICYMKLIEQCII